MDGLILIDKPAGITSHRVVEIVRKKLHQKKVGHCGTLDPFATGLLLITLGQATKISGFLEKQTKHYQGIIQLGTKTDTGDYTGTVIDSAIIPPIGSNDLDRICTQFIGVQHQMPPMYSAKKINGKKLYELAREGKVIERAIQTIEIFDLRLELISNDQLSINVRCSAGTYVRTLGEDIAESLHTLGHLTVLRRIQSGPFLVDNSLDVETITSSILPLSISASLSHIPQVEVTLLQEKDIRNGKVMEFDLVEDMVLVLSMNNQIALAIYTRKEGTKFECHRGLWAQEEG